MGDIADEYKKHHLKIITTIYSSREKSTRVLLNNLNEPHEQIIGVGPAILVLFF